MMHRSSSRLMGLVFAAAIILLVAPTVRAEVEMDAQQLLSATLDRWADLIEKPGDQPRAIAGTIRIVQADGLAGAAQGASAKLLYQAPDHIRLDASVGDESFLLARDGGEVWAYRPAKKFGVLGSPDVPRFRADPASVENTQLPAFRIPLSRLQLRTMSWLVTPQALPAEKIDGVTCNVLKITPKPAAQAMGIGDAQMTFWIRRDNWLPARITASNGGRLNVRIDITGADLIPPPAAEAWKLKPADGDKVERVALAHLVRFAQVLPRLMNQSLPPLGPATGERKVIAMEGAGRLEEIDGTQVIVLKGTPEEMGRQHGVLLKERVRDLVDRVLYGVGVGGSFERGSWFFGDIENAVAHFQPFVGERYTREMDAIASAAGLHPQESRLANFFPELFHCSGFSVWGKATTDGHMYHGRILDYMRGVGLEQNAVVIVHQPDVRNAWVNVGYAGFVGSVTAMNEKGISLGEMGGKGYGHWDGKPMAQLVGEVMEKANTLDEAVEIMRKGPRTCEYYYVISDGKKHDAVGIAATHDTFEVIRPGESHPKLQYAIPDAVLMSAGDRYEELARRVKAGYGKFDADSARELMSRPVCMTSNIQSALFAPDTLDFWVANADGTNVASHTRFTKYNLRELLTEQPPQSADARQR